MTDDALIELSRLGRDALIKVAAKHAGEQLGELFVGFDTRRISTTVSRGLDRRATYSAPSGAASANPFSKSYKQHTLWETARRARLGLAVVMALAGSAGVSQAQGFVDCNFVTGVTCMFGEATGGLGKVITVPQPLDADDLQAQRERERAWEAHCHPIVDFDRYGVARYTYAHASCEFGR